MKKLEKKDYLYISILFLVVIAFVLYLSFKGYFFGSNVDWENQHIIIPEYFRTLFYSNGKILPTLALNIGMGQNIFYFSYYGLLSPIILISYLMPHIPMYIFIPSVSIISFLTSILMFYTWIKKKYDSNIAFLASIIFTLSGPLLYHSHRHIMFVIYIPFLIGALKSVDDYFENKRVVPLILYTFLMIMTSYYYSVPGIIVIGVYALYHIIKNNNKISWESFIPLFKIIYFVIIAILLSAVLLLPTIYALKEGRLDTNYSPNLLSLLIPKLDYKLSFYYSYSLGLTFIYVISLINCFINKKRENIFLSIVLFICMLIPLASYILNGLMYVDGKCFIPFIPLALIIICEFLNNLFQEKINFKRLLWFLLPTTVIMLYFAIDYSLLSLLILDILLNILFLIVIWKSKKNCLIFIPIIIISLISCYKVNENENYVLKSDLSKQNNSAYNKLLDNVSGFYRTANNDMLLNNPNKIYNINQYSTTMYASSSNNYYTNFVRNIFKNEVYNKDNLTITQSSNLLFNMYSGTKYLLTSGEPLLGYNLIAEKNGVSLYQNNDILPIGYATSKVMSQREFDTLEYPYTIDALLNYAVVDIAEDNVYSSNVREYKTEYKVLEKENLEINSLDNGYKIISENKGHLKLKLDNLISNKVLIIQFKMNKEKEGYGCSTDVKINGMNNSLSCSNWKYHNHNNSFEYVLSSNDNFDTLDINFTNGEYDISDIKLYTINYSTLRTINNNVDEFIIDDAKTTDNVIEGSINVKENGYFKLTVPYENEGYKIYIDGKRVAKVLTDETFLGCAINKGTHTIRITYTTPKLKAGIITSLIGAALLLTIVFYKKIKKPLDYLAEHIVKYLKWASKKIWQLLKNNKGYVYLFFSMFILDFALRLFYNKSVDFYSFYKIVPNLFSILWIVFILNLTKLFKKKTGKTIYLISYVFSFILFLVHAIYYSYFKLFFDYSVLRVAGEGTEYYDTVLLNIKYWVVIVGIVSIFLTIKGLKSIKHQAKFNPLKLVMICAGFTLLHAGLPLALGSKITSVEWDDWRNERSIYSSFNDNNKSMMVAGMYEYNIRNFYVNFIRNNNKLSEKEEDILNNNFKDAQEKEANDYTGAFKGKNLILVQLESVDEFLLDPNIMPTFYELSKNSINFTDHYSFTSGGGSTFNSEYMVNTGYSTAYNYNQNAYAFSRNTYAYSLPNLFKKLGYSANAFHMNSSEYYSRGVNYKAFGYDEYYGLKDLGIYKNNEFWLDTELLKNEKFNNKIFNNEGLSLSYLITYTAHMPYKTTKGTCGMLTSEEGLTEFECLKIQAKETDDFLKLLLQNLEKNNMLNNTILAIFSDHYLYTLEDQTLLDKYKTTNNNLINHTPFIIWSNGQIKKTVKNVNSQLDILPTLLNLFGIKYYPNNYIGRDILDNSFDPLVFFSDGSWYNGKTYVANGEYQSGSKMTDEKLNQYNNLVKNKMSLNDAVLKADYFAKK